MRSLIFLASTFLFACSDVDDHDHEENVEEVITTVELTFTPQGGGSASVFTWEQLDAGADPTIDDITLMDANDYDLTVRFLNALESPAEDISVEVEDEGDQHQVFFTGAGVASEATDGAGASLQVDYDDADANGNPIGLANTVMTLGVGTGDLTVTLRHMPPESDTPVKTATAAADVAAGGFAAIGGDNDVQVTLPFAVE